MHESLLVRRLVDRAAAAAGHEHISDVHIVVGAMSAVSSRAVRLAFEQIAAAEWGYVPDVEVDVSTDIMAPDAMAVVLQSVHVGL